MDESSISNYTDEDPLGFITTDIDMGSLAGISTAAIAKKKQSLLEKSNGTSNDGSFKKLNKPTAEQREAPRIPDPAAVQQAGRIFEKFLDGNQTSSKTSEEPPKKRSASPSRKKSAPAQTEETEKQQLLARLQKYYDYFPYLAEEAQSIRKIRPTDSISVIQEELNRCASSLASSNVLENVKSADIFFAGLLEKILPRIGVPCYGLAAEAKASQLVLDKELKEFAIKYEAYFRTGPELRYLAGIAKRLDTVMTKNMNIFADLSGDQRTPENKYDDL